jgi:hypothetical protein
MLLLSFSTTLLIAVPPANRWRHSHRSRGLTV